VWTYKNRTWPSFPCVLYALPISSYFILSYQKYFAKSTDYKIARVIFFSLLLIRLTSKYFPHHPLLIAVVATLFNTFRVFPRSLPAITVAVFVTSYHSVCASLFLSNALRLKELALFSTNEKSFNFTFPGSNVANDIFLSPVAPLEHRATVKCSFHNSFLIFRQSVGFLGQGINPSQGLYLHTEQHKDRINIHSKYPCPRRDSNPRSQRPSEQRQFMT
jgi:hypothetical protein